MRAAGMSCDFVGHPVVAEALAIGKLKSWDHQPLVDASQQYMRNHIDLDDLERKARYPQPAPLD